MGDSSESRKLRRWGIALFLAAIYIRVIFIFFGGPARWVPPAPSKRAGLHERMDAVVRSFAKTYPEFHGAVFVAKNGKSIFRAVIGISPSGHTIDEHTVFPIGSVSKQFTASAMLELEKQGKLSLEDTVCRFLSVFCERELAKITIRNLLEHRSWLPRDRQGFGKRLDLAVRAVMDGPERGHEGARDFLGQNPPESRLEFPPGSSYLYSNYGYQVASAVIEVVTKQRFDVAMETLVFLPHRLRNTRVVRPEEDLIGKSILPSYSVKYSIFSTPKIEEFPEVNHIGHFYGSGAVVSTFQDLLAWSLVLEQDPEDKRFHPGSGSYALGFRVGKTKSATRHYSHNGTVLGYHAQFHMLPEEHLFLGIFMNAVEGTLDDELAEQLVNAMN